MHKHQISISLTVITLIGTIVLISRSDTSSRIVGKTAGSVKQQTFKNSNLTIGQTKPLSTTSEIIGEEEPFDDGISPELAANLSDIYQEMEQYDQHFLKHGMYKDHIKRKFNIEHLRQLEKAFLKSTFKNDQEREKSAVQRVMGIKYLKYAASIGHTEELKAIIKNVSHRLINKIGLPKGSHHDLAALLRIYLETTFDKATPDRLIIDDLRNLDVRTTGQKGSEIDIEIYHAVKPWITEFSLQDQVNGNRELFILEQLGPDK